MRKGSVALDVLRQATDAKRGRPCDTCTSGEFTGLIDEVFEAFVAKPDDYRRLRYSTLLKALNDQGYPSRDPRTLRLHMRKCRPDLWRRVLAVRPEFDGTR